MRTKLLLLAFLEGGLVMLFETASPIVVAPVLGHSVMIWATMLSLAIGSLALGYFLGAWFTKKVRSYAFLMRLFLITSLVILLGWILMYAQNYFSTDLVTANYSAVITVFLLIIPLILFGSSTPVIISLLDDSQNGDSSLAGKVFSISTVGGILFSLLTGYYLIDALGVSDTILTGLLLTTLFPLFYFFGQKSWLYTGANAALTLGVLILLFSQRELPETDDFKTIHFSEGITGQLIVADYIENDTEHRLLLINRMGQTKINKATNFSAWTYVNYVTSAASMYPAGSKTLVLGLGGGIVPNQIKHYLGHSVDAVELDERIIELSDLYFDNLNANVNKIADDARRYVKSSVKSYDFIVLDIFNGEIMPSHGLSKEAFEDIDEILKPGGLIVVNFNGFINGKEGIAGRSLVKTLKSAGFTVKILDCGAGQEEEKYRNLLYFAYKEPPRWNDVTIQIKIEGKKRKIGDDFLPMPNISGDNAYVITDDKPMMEYLNRYAAASWRKDYLKSYTKVFKEEHNLPLVK